MSAPRVWWSELEECVLVEQAPGYDEYVTVNGRTVSWRSCLPRDAVELAVEGGHG